MKTPLQVMKSALRRKLFGCQQENIKLITGFTLIEVLVSVSIFTMVALAAIASVIAANDLAKKTQNIRNAFDNLNFAIESMSRNIRLGSDYRCPDGAGGGSECKDLGVSSISLTDSEDAPLAYGLSPDGKITRTKGGVTNDLTSSQVIKINRLDFLVCKTQFCAGSTPTQPRVVILIQGESLGKSSLKSKFSIQTSVSQRLLQKKI